MKKKGVTGQAKQIQTKDDTATSMLKIVSKSQNVGLGNNTKSQPEPDLVVVGLLTRRAVDIYRQSLSGRPCRPYEIGFTGKKSLTDNRSSLLRLAYDGLRDGDIAQFILHELETLERLKAFTFATPGLEVAMPEVVKLRSEYGNLKFLSLAQALAAKCAEAKAFRVLVVGSNFEACGANGLSRSSDWFWNTLKEKGIRPALRSEGCIYNAIMYNIECGFNISTYCQNKVYDSFEFYRKLVLARMDDLDGVLVCNPELHELSVKLREMFPKLEIIDAFEVHQELINDHLAKEQP